MLHNISSLSSEVRWPRVNFVNYESCTMMYKMIFCNINVFNMTMI